MRILRVFLYLILVGYIAFVGIMAFSGHQPPVSGIRIPNPSARSIQWGFQVKEIATREPRYMAKARKLFVDSRGKTFLSQGVIIEIPGSRTFIYSEKCTVSPGKNRVQFPEKVRVRSETGLFSGEKSLYLAKKGVIRLEGQVSFKIGKISGRAEGGRMDLEKKEIFLFKPRFSSEGNLLEGKRIKVYETDMKAVLRGKPAKMNSEETMVFAPVMEIDIKGKRVNSISMPSGGRIFQKGKRTVGKTLKFWVNGRIEGERVVARWGGRKLFASRITGEKERLKAFQAFVQSGDLTLTADTILLRESEIKAEGKVQGKIGNSSFQSDALLNSGGRRVLSGNVRIIKEGNIITCDEAEETEGKYILKNATIISPQGFKLTASTVKYTDEKMLLEGGATIKSEDLLVSAPKIEIQLRNGKLEKLVARQARKIILGKDSARCEVLTYYFPQGKAVLQGKVILKSSKHGEVKGESMVVYPKTGAFEITGRGRTSSEIKE